MRIPFSKMQGAGNDFVVVTGDERDWAALATEVCDRRAGAGADGVLVALPSAGADVRMRMYNPDGTEDECGNGLRCLALYACSRGLVKARRFTVETLSGVKEVAVSGGEAEALVAAEMGWASLDPADVPAHLPPWSAEGAALDVGGEMLRVHALSTGTAHAVIFGIPDEVRFQRLSPLIEHHPAFPERTSVMWTELLDEAHARVRIWERAAGETLACGTGACAVAAAAHVTGRAGRRLEVASRGGVLTVDVGPGLALRMTGPAAFVYEGVWLARRAA
jgi:diaminopimelate epimerase